MQLSKSSVNCSSTKQVSAFAGCSWKDPVMSCYTPIIKVAAAPIVQQTSGLVYEYPYVQVLTKCTPLYTKQTFADIPITSCRQRQFYSVGIHLAGQSLEKCLKINKLVQ